MTIVNLPDNNIVPPQQKKGYSYPEQFINADYVCDSSNEKEKIEPFDCEKDALEFVNFYSQKVLNEER